MRVAIVHYWLIGMRGGEKVLEALCRMFPDADIYTHVYDPQVVSETIRRHRIRTTFIARLPFAHRFYQKYLPLMPLALEELDLTGYDLIISSEAGPAKGIIPGPGAVHLCYVHSPMRYIWDQYHVYKRDAGFLARMMMPSLSHRLRIWDVTAAARVDCFLANSTHVANRIGKYYRREATVVHPPVAVDDFSPAPRKELGDYYLWAGELVGYKRPDLAVEAFNQLAKPLVIIGGGESRRHLERMAKDNITFLGKVNIDTLKHHMARCKALIFPGEEDFGIIPVEVMASGRPVIAFGKGGILDTVIDGEMGVLFKEKSVKGLIEAVRIFERENLDALDPSGLVFHARQFSESAFITGFLGVLADHGVNRSERP